MPILQIVLVEDNPAEVLLFREALRSLSAVIHVTVAYDGERALELFREPEFQAELIVLDLNLPKINGQAVLEAAAIRELPPVVVFTISENPQEREQALALGASDYVVKPRTLEEYTAAVHAIVGRWLSTGEGASAGSG